MKRLVRIALVALPLVTLAAAPAYAEVKTRDKTTVKFEGMLGRCSISSAARPRRKGSRRRPR